MISSEFDAERSRGRIVLRPNRSWTWRANACLVLTLVAVSGSMGLLFAYHGMWLVLPFTALELAALFACLYCCVRRTHTQEVLTFSRRHLVYEAGVGRPERRQRFQRYFARFFVKRPLHPWYRTRIALRCREQELEIGSFLSADERDHLITALRDMIHHLDHSVATAARQ